VIIFGSVVFDIKEVRTTPVAKKNIWLIGFT
jgi:hypothetical protein